MSNLMEIGWCTDRSQAALLGEFFERYAGPDYISHSEIQCGRAEQLGHWRPGLAGIVAREIERRLPQEKEHGDFGVVTAHAADQLVGLALVSFQGEGLAPFGVLEDLVVETTRRDQGIGRQILAWIETEFARQGICRVFLESGLENQRGHAFFRRHGYEPCSVVMMKDL